MQLHCKMVEINDLFRLSNDLIQQINAFKFFVKTRVPIGWQ